MIRLLQEFFEVIAEDRFEQFFSLLQYLIFERKILILRSKGPQQPAELKSASSSGQQGLV